ncbi:hypothetical protein P3T76_009657 [Phytophthora citrophthora]|uniref:EF-hand domain-containing protein n=1 Tax=Phytophthora citrophthora TaxID=4793 RepID=A0AAD9GGC4_9STRA|nr:hypothetical protein P3T76_009657 [Phytophthora citrophthora]
MPKETEFYNAAPANDTAQRATTAIEAGGSTSSLRYRVSSRPSDLLVPSLTDTPEFPTRPPDTHLSTSNVTTLLKRLSKNSASRLSISGSSGAEGSLPGTTSKHKNARYAVTTESGSPLKGAGNIPKLPQKLRQHVSRLRGQFALGSSAGSSRNLSVGGRSPSPTAPSSKASRLSMNSAAINSRRFSIAAVAAIQYSRRSNQLQQLQVTKEGETATKPVAEVPKPPASPHEPTVVSAGTFQDLLRPLQTSLSCASLNAGWSSDEEDEAEQLFRQSERESSRMLHVCCSIDNLMMSISDQAQEQKKVESIVRGATRDLVKLFQFAMKQAISVIFDNADDQFSSSNLKDEGTRAVQVKVDGKEAQYAMEFLLEINERIGKLYEFARSVFVNEAEGFQQRIAELEDQLAAASLRNEQLQTEMRDLRDFHEHNSVNPVNSFAVDESNPRHQVSDNENSMISALAFPEVQDFNSEGGEDESSALKMQCQELSRFLDMAKQEIRLSHHERDVQKARVAEISSALFHDSELGMLRNQLQSEKQRVRILESENLTLRESQQEQAMKLQSLETLQAAALLSAASPSTIGRPNNEVTRPSIYADTNSSTLMEQQSSAPRSDSPEQCFTPACSLPIETEDNQYNFTYSGVAQPGDVVQGSVVNWFTRIINPPQPALARKPRKKQVKSQQEQPPLAGMSKILAELLMTDKQLATAKEESKIRRQGNIPTLIPPMRAQSARREGRSTEDQSIGKKRRPRSATATSALSNNINATNSETQENPEEIIACCLQLVWMFYQRFLLAVEAQNLLATRGLGGDPNLGSCANSSVGNPVMEPVSLSLIIFHFFLERCSRELDAARELEQFVRCVHNTRSASYKLELFCQFLDGSCSRQELCFYLWICQAMDDVKLGIPYEDPLPVNQDHHDESTQFICVLKATFLARAIFRLLHFKVLCRPPSAGGNRRRRKAKQNPMKRTNSSAAITVAPISPSPGSPKRRPKTRLGELSAVLSPDADTKIPTGRNGEEPTVKSVPQHIAARLELHDIIENNQNEPITLEAFNKLLLQYAVVPTLEELSTRLGPFYQPTGDEQKIPTDVFLALLMETYRFQLQWQRDQLRALFIHLNHQEVIQNRAVELHDKTEVANIKDGKRGSKEGKVQSKPRMKRRKSRDGVDNGNKYLRGLSRNVLRELLLQSGVVHDVDVAQVDIDWLFAELLKNAGGIAADITFDGVYDSLEKMRWLDSSKLRVDALGEVSKVTRNSGMKTSKMALKAESTSLLDSSPRVRAIRDKWRVYARHSLALCSNDPNVFVRRHSQRLLHFVDQALFDRVSRPGNSGCGDAIQCVREFLEFAWRVATKRSSRTVAPILKQTCLTEMFLVSQALRATADSIPGYDAQFATAYANGIDCAEPSGDKIIMRNSLQSFYDTSRMNLNHIFNRDKQINTAATSNSSLGQHLQELENVLTLYAAHIAHLFQRFSEARFNCAPQVSSHRWRAMVYELGLVDLRHLPFTKLQSLFVAVATRSGSESRKDIVKSASLDQELGVVKTQFSELFVLIAVERHLVAVTRSEKARLGALKKTQNDSKEIFFEAVELADRPGRIMAQFCSDILAPRAFAADNTLVERNFEAKLSCPLVGRALLEHRSFLRTIFFFYAKQDEVAADEQAALEEQKLIRELQENGGQIDGLLQVKDPVSSMVDASAALLIPDPGSDFQLEKTKRSSMSFGEFQTFLTAFGLLETSSNDKAFNKVSLTAAQQIFSSVMSLDNDDTLQLEFDEFTSAVVALAVHLNPNPFSLWYQKLDVFATKLQSEWETQNEKNSSA